MKALNCLKKYRIAALLLCLVLLVSMLSACAAQAAEVPAHEHAYAKKWESDANAHWLPLVCECKDVDPVKIPHIDKNGDLKCDVCNAVSHTHSDADENGVCDSCAEIFHTHTFATEWSYDCADHWLAATCGHGAEKRYLSSHVDVIPDGKCDVCQVEIAKITQHSYDDDWTHDAEYHWHAPTCKHENVPVEKIAHTLDDAYFCKECEATVAPEEGRLQNLLESAKIMGVGWSAIFGVTLFIILCIFLMNKLSGKTGQKDE